MREYTIDEQGHTIGCMLRPRLFENGATFAACVVLHPQDKHLVMKVEAADADQCVINAIYAATKDLDQMIREVDTFITHNSLTTEMDVE
jgi:DNA-directed RNA polymerase subunit L